MKGYGCRDVGMWSLMPTPTRLGFDVELGRSFDINEIWWPVQLCVFVKAQSNSDRAAQPYFLFFVFTKCAKCYIFNDFRRVFFF